MKTTRLIRAALMLAACAPALVFARPAHAVMPPAAGGPLPPEVRTAIASGMIASAPRASTKAVSPVVDAAAATVGRWNVPVLLVDFPDRRAVYAKPQFQTLLFDTTHAVPTGSVADYYDEVSGGALQVRGQVFGWRTLPDTVNFYANDSYGLARLAFPQNDAGLVYAAAKAYDDSVDFANYDRDGDGLVDVLFVVHSSMGAEGSAGDRRRFWSITTTLSNQWGTTGPYVTKDPRPGHPGQFMKIETFCILPEMSAVELNLFTEIGVYCHEFGHALGWPDLYDTSSLGGGSNLGPANWCLMSTGAYGPNNHTPSRPTHPCGWCKWDAGWITLENLTQDGDRTFQPIEIVRKAYRLWFQGEPSDEWFLLENRQRVGFDAGLPGHGLLVSRIRSDVFEQRRNANTVNSSFPPGLRVEEADNRFDMMTTLNRGDARDPFPGTTGNVRFADDAHPSTQTYDGRPLNTSLQAIREVGSDVLAYVQLLPTGWSEPIDMGPIATGGGFAGNSVQPLVADAQGDLWLAASEDVAGQTEVTIRRKRFGVAWTQPIAVTNEPGVSASPCLAIDKNGRKVLAWWDTRDGNSEIYYAWAPAGGSFGPARRVTNQPAFSQVPAVAWTADGRIALAWMDGRDGGSSIYARVFFPDGEAAKTDVRVSYPEPFTALANSAAPSIATAGNRIAILYQERIAGVDEVKACVDSGAVWTEARLLSATDGFTSNQPTLTAESDTSVWLFWRDNLPQNSEIRQARWSRLRGYDLAFNSAYRSAQNVDSPRAFQDTRGDVHVLLRRTNPSGQIELVESVWHRIAGVWDAGPSLLATFKDEQLGGSAYALDALGRTHLVWLGTSAQGRRLVERVRLAPAVDPVAVGPGSEDASPARISAAPNPARGHIALTIETGARRPLGTRVFLVTVAGRRIASFDAAGEGIARLSWDGRDSAGGTVAPGVVFVHVVDPTGGVLARGRFVWLP